MSRNEGLSLVAFPVVSKWLGSERFVSDDAKILFKWFFDFFAMYCRYRSWFSLHILSQSAGSAEMLDARRAGQCKLSTTGSNAPQEFNEVRTDSPSDALLQSTNEEGWFNIFAVCDGGGETSSI